MPSAAAKTMSSRSRSESAGAEMPPPWRLSPLRSESAPPTRTRVSMLVPATRTTSSTICPSFSSSVSPELTSFGRFLYATPTACALPLRGSSAVSRVKGAPSLSCTDPSRKHSMRIFGPARSSSTPTQRSARCAASRTCARRRRRSSTVPCEALRRTTSSPARIIWVSTCGSSVAGPSVATILARRRSAPRPSSITSALLQHGLRRQGLAFDELEERAAACGNVGNAVLHPVLLDGSEGVSAAGERERLAARDRLRDGARPLAELLEFEHPDRSVPDDGAGRLEQRAAAIGGVGADVENHLVAAHFADRAHIGVRRGRKLAAHDHVRRQGNLRIAGARLVHESPCDIQHLRLAQRAAHVHPGGGKEGVGDATTHDELVYPIEQRLEHQELGRHLGAADDRHQRPGGLPERPLQRLELPDQQRTGARHGSKPGHPVGTGLGPVRGAEGVHHEHLAQRRHAARELLIVLLLSFEKTYVLAQHGAAEGAVHPVDPVLAQRHGLAEQLREPRRYGCEGERGILLALLWTTEVRQDEHPGMLIERITDGRQ